MITLSRFVPELEVKYDKGKIQDHKEIHYSTKFDVWVLEASWGRALILKYSGLEIVGARWGTAGSRKVHKVPRWESLTPTEISCTWETKVSGKPKIGGTNCNGCIKFPSVVSQLSSKEKGKTLGMVFLGISNLVEETPKYFWLLLYMSSCEPLGLPRVVKAYWVEMEV